MGELFTAIAKVMGEVRSLPKNGFNKQSSYNYVANDDALEAIGKAMAKYGVVVIPSMVQYDTVTDGKMTRAKAEFDMTVCAADGSTFVSRWIAEGIDYGNPDKALTKAITYATKTFLLKLFIVGAGGEDPDSESAPADEKPQRNAPNVKQLDPERHAAPKQALATQSTETQHRGTNGKSSQANKKADPDPVADIISKNNITDPKSAQEWSVSSKHCTNPHHARNRMAKIVDDSFDGKLTQTNVKQVIAAFVAKCLAEGVAQPEQAEPVAA